MLIIRPGEGPVGYYLLRLNFKEWVLFNIINSIFIFFIFVPKLTERFENNDSYICPSCDDVVEKLDKRKVHICKKCNVDLVLLKGYFNSKKPD